MKRDNYIEELRKVIHANLGYYPEPQATLQLQQWANYIFYYLLSERYKFFDIQESDKNIQWFYALIATNPRFKVKYKLVKNHFILKDKFNAIGKNQNIGN